MMTVNLYDEPPDEVPVEHNFFEGPIRGDPLAESDPLATATQDPLVDCKPTHISPPVSITTKTVPQVCTPSLNAVATPKSLLTSKPCQNLAKDNASVPPKYSSMSLTEFTQEMGQSISEIVQESVLLFGRDPREYHPFYLRIYKYLAIGQRLGYLSKQEPQINQLWKGFFTFAKNQFDVSKRNPKTFSGERSPYATFLIMKMVVINGKVVDLPKESKNERRRKFKALETAARNIQREWEAKAGVAQNIREDFQTLLKFFAKCVIITNPVDMVKMNNIWTKFLKTKGFEKALDITEDWSRLSVVQPVPETETSEQGTSIRKAVSEQGNTDSENRNSGKGVVKVVVNPSPSSPPVIARLRTPDPVPKSPPPIIELSPLPSPTPPDSRGDLSPRPPSPGPSPPSSPCPASPGSPYPASPLDPILKSSQTKPKSSLSKTDSSLRNRKNKQKFGKAISSKSTPSLVKISLNILELKKKSLGQLARRRIVNSCSTSVSRQLQLEKLINRPKAKLLPIPKIKRTTNTIDQSRKPDQIPSEVESKSVSVIKSNKKITTKEVNFLRNSRIKKAFQLKKTGTNMQTKVEVMINRKHKKIRLKQKIPDKKSDKISEVSNSEKENDIKVKVEAIVPDASPSPPLSPAHHQTQGDQEGVSTSFPTENNETSPDNDNSQMEKCIECSKKFPASYLPIHHNLTHKDGLPDFHCPACKRLMSDNRSLWYHFCTYHLKDHNLGSLDPCSLIPPTSSNSNVSKPRKPPAPKSVPPKPKSVLPASEPASKISLIIPENLPCKHCGKEFSTKQSLDRHVFTMHGDGTLPENYLICPYCPKQYKSKDTVDWHVRKDHLGSINSQCPDCNRDFQSSGKLWRHMIDEHGTSPGDAATQCNVKITQCIYCGEEALVGRQIRNHTKANHPEKLEEFLLAETSDYLLIRKSSQKIYQRMYKRPTDNTITRKNAHTREMRRKAREEGIGPAWLLREIAEKRSDKTCPDRVPCPAADCKTLCRGLQNLQTHMRICHSNKLEETVVAKKLVKLVEESILCTVSQCILCEEYLYSVEDVRVHMVIRHPEVFSEVVSALPGNLEPTNCSHCIMTFWGPKELREHVEISHPEKCWKCPECDVVVLDTKDLENHFKLFHMEIEVFEVTDESVKSMLKKIQRQTRISFTKKYAIVMLNCEICGQKLQMKNYTDHVLSIHGIEENGNILQCEFCLGKKFMTREGFLHHMNALHRKDVDMEQLVESMSKVNTKEHWKNLNPQNPEGVEIVKPKRKRIRIRKSKKKCVGNEEKPEIDPETGELLVKRNRQIRTSSRIKATKSRARKRKADFESEETEEEEIDDKTNVSEHVRRISQRLKRRKVLVYCDEDEEIGTANADVDDK